MGADVKLRFTNAQFAWWLARANRLFSTQLARQAEGMWNPDFCSADATDIACSVHEELREMMAHLDKRLLQATEPIQ